MKISLSTYYEVIKGIIFISLVCMAIYFGYKAVYWINTKVDAVKENTRIELEANRQRFELELNQIRVQTNIVSEGSKEWKDQIAELKRQNKELMELINKNGEEIKNIGMVTATANENISLELKKVSDHTYLAGTGDLNEQYFKKVNISGKDGEKEVSFPIAWSIFYPNSKEWKTGVYPVEWKLKIVQSEQKDGQWNTYTESWLENNKDDASVGIKIPLKVDAEFSQLKKTSTEFYWWAPHVSLNGDINQNLEAGAGLSFSFSGYGRTKNDLIWKFLEFGVSKTADDYWLKFSPVGYNIGESLPFISNLFLSPFVGYDSKQFLGGLSLSVPF
jgi:hypothetical protein